MMEMLCICIVQYSGHQTSAKCNYVNVELGSLFQLINFLIWHIVGKIMETVADFIFLGSKITADGDLQPWN